MDKRVGGLQEPRDALQPECTCYYLESECPKLYVALDYTTSLSTRIETYLSPTC